jgi:hypothetical protein
MVMDSCGSTADGADGAADVSCGAKADVPDVLGDPPEIGMYPPGSVPAEQRRVIGAYVPADVPADVLVKSDTAIDSDVSVVPDVTYDEELKAYRSTSGRLYSKRDEAAMDTRAHEFQAFLAWANKEEASQSRFTTSQMIFCVEMFPEMANLSWDGSTAWRDLAA